VSIFDIHVCRVRCLLRFFTCWFFDEFVHDLGLDVFGHVFLSGLGRAPSLHNVAYFFVHEPDVELFLRVGQVVGISFMFFSLGLRFGLLQFFMG